MNRDDRHPHVTAQIERLRQARRRHVEMFRRAIEAERVFDAEAARE
jgi:hypothetical protein